MIAILNGEDDRIVGRIIDQSPSIDINLKDKSGSTALYYACTHLRKNIALLLLDRNADFTLQPDSYKSHSILQLAVKNGLDVVVQRILQEAPSHDYINHVNRWEKTALTYAIQNKHVDIAQVLIRYGADPRNIIVNGHYRGIQSILKDAMNESHRVDVLVRLRWLQWHRRLRLHRWCRRLRLHQWPRCLNYIRKKIIDVVDTENRRRRNQLSLVTNVVDEVMGMNDDVFNELRDMMTPPWYN